MSLKTNAINAAVLLSSFFMGSKIVEFKIFTNRNDNYIEDLNILANNSKIICLSKLNKLTSEIKRLRLESESRLNSEAQRIENNLSSEKIRLKNEFDTKMAVQVKIMEDELLKFKNEVIDDISNARASFNTLGKQLDEFKASKIEMKKLEDLSKRIIEDESFGSLDQRLSMTCIYEELNGMLPILRQYDLNSASNFSVFGYYCSKAFSKLLFVGSSMMKSDIIDELKLSVEKNDLHRTLFIFNKLEGWSRLILKDWAGKCKKRLEFIDEIKYKLYLNK